MIPSAEEHRKLNQEANIEKIYKAQIPEGLTLDEMIGACPGAAGEVKLTYYPFTNSENTNRNKWVAVDENKNYHYTMETGKSYARHEICGWN